MKPSGGPVGADVEVDSLYAGMAPMRNICNT